MQNSTGINTAQACAPSSEPSLSVLLASNCEKAQQARNTVYRIANCLFSQIPCESSKTPSATCAMEKAFEESIVLDELLSTLGLIVDRL